MQKLFWNTHDSQVRRSREFAPLLAAQFVLNSPTNKGACQKLYHQSYAAVLVRPADSKAMLQLL